MCTISRNHSSSSMTRIRFICRPPSPAALRPAALSCCAKLVSQSCAKLRQPPPVCPLTSRGRPTLARPLCHKQFLCPATGCHRVAPPLRITPGLLAARLRHYADDCGPGHSASHANLPQSTDFLHRQRARPAGWRSTITLSLGGRQISSAVSPHKTRPRQPHRRGEMRDARIMADKRAAACQPARQVRQRQALRHPRARGRQRGGQRCSRSPSASPPTRSKSKSVEFDQVLQQLRPFRFRPVLALAAAAGMKGQRVDS